MGASVGTILYMELQPLTHRLDALAGSFVQCSAFLMLPWLMRHGMEPESYALPKLL